MTGRAWWRRSLKALHQIAGIAGGGLAACLVIGMRANAASPVEFATSRQVIAAIARYAATRAFHDAGRAWVKALLGPSVFEATLLSVGASSRQAERAAAGADPRSSRRFCTPGATRSGCCSRSRSPMSCWRCGVPG